MTSNFHKLLIFIASLLCLITANSSFARIKTVVIDAGHGGDDRGGNTRGIYEKYLTLDVAFRLRNWLENKGVNVVMTRTRDVFVPLRTRANIANNRRKSIFVSIHFNYTWKRSVSGIETFWYNGTASYYLARYVQSSLIDKMRANNRGVKRNSFVVISKTRVPAILVECGFLSNYRESKRYFEKSERDKLADAIGRGILKFIKKY